jgi:hypothetical protein
LLPVFDAPEMGEIIMNREVVGANFVQRKTHGMPS